MIERKEFKTIVNDLIGDRRSRPKDNKQWRIRYSAYEPIEAMRCARRVKNISKKWKKPLECIWSADTMHGQIQGWV